MINFKALLIIRIVSTSINLILQLYRDHREQDQASSAKPKFNLALLWS